MSTEKENTVSEVEEVKLPNRFKPFDFAKGDKLYASIYEDGRIWLNRDVVSVFSIGDYKSAVLSSDEDAGHIGILFCRDEVPNSFPIWMEKKGRGAAIRCSSFINYHNLCVEKSTRYNLIKDESCDDFFYFDLSSGVKVSKERKKKEE